MTEFPLSPFPTPAELARTAQRRRLLDLTMICAVVLALAVLAACGPADVDITRSGVPATVPKVVPMSAVPAVPLVTTTTSAPPAPTTSALPLQEVAEPPAPQAVTPAGSVDHSGIWDRLRECEAPDWSGGWLANTGNGYYGGLQFSLRSWESVGGTGCPHHASRETQIAMGERLLELQGWGAWPACSKRLGLR